jgi:serine/threonine-protein kinase RsbW
VYLRESPARTRARVADQLSVAILLAMSSAIRLTMPGTLEYRPLAVRLVAEAARLVSGSERRDPRGADAHEIHHPFDTAVVSAFMEIFNNVAVHAYEREPGLIEIEVSFTPNHDELVIDVTDHGTPFDPRNVRPLPQELDDDSLPESGMGMHIATAMVDELAYHPGPPNLWRMSKRAWRR